MNGMTRRLLARLAMISVGGTMFGFLGLFEEVTPINGGCLEAARFFNPCADAGEVFTPAVCSQAEFDDLFDGFGPNFERDPFCSLPQTCTDTITFDEDAGDGETGSFDDLDFVQVTDG